MKLTLHVGMPKCGSSSLQSVLSSEEFERKAGRRRVYAALLKDGSIVRGRALRQRARSNLTGYQSSDAATKVTALGESAERKAVRSLKKLGRRYDQVILSCEGWGSQPHLFGDDHFFGRLGAQVEVLAWTRPQVSWFNSAWWQWGAWSIYRYEQWFSRTLQSKCFWGHFLESWNEIKWVDRVQARVLRPGVLEDTLSDFGVTSVDAPPVNVGMPEAVVRFFQKNRQFRSKPNDIEMESVLGRHLSFDRMRKPWVVTTSDAERIIDNYRQDLERLKAFLPDEDIVRLEKDKSWFDPGFYSNKEPVDPEEGDISRDDLERLLYKSFLALADLDRAARVACQGERVPRLKRAADILGRLVQSL